ITIIMNVTLTDLNKNITLYLDNSVLISKMDQLDESPDVLLKVDKLTFYKLTFRKLTVDQAVEDGKLVITGDGNKLNELVSLFDHFTYALNIVTP
ncbi:alkyl sulfatase C-terminal domain-containing protein, partial [Bacillus sp. JJ722]|uniref:alkyl sulfatase C-terminal domain-containing protein n=1 Tax=Bacillus sp. JJ722 TaxID=3122973 RepID=UPI002FFDEC5E